MVRLYIFYFFIPPPPPPRPAKPILSILLPVTFFLGNHNTLAKHILYMLRHILCFIQIPFKICTQYTYTRVHTHTDRGFWRSGGYPLLQLSQSPPNQPAPLPIFLQVPTSSMPIHLWLKILANLMLPSLQETRKWWWWWSSTLLLPGGVYSPQTLQQSFIDLLYIWEYIPFPYLPQYFPLLFPHTLFLSASYFLILSISSPPLPL